MTLLLLASALAAPDAPAADAPAPDAPRPATPAAATTRAAAAAAVALEAPPRTGDAPAAAAAGEVPAGAPGFVAEADQVLRLDDDLGVPSDLMLQGLGSTQTLAFAVPGAWELFADPVLDLRFDHSAVLDAGRSTLTVRVNDRALASVRLDATNAVDGVLPVPIPRSLLQPYNRLQFQVAQHVADECEDPFDPSLWTRVATTTTLTLPARRKADAPDLLAWPYPFVDARGYGPVRVTLVEDAPPLASALDALGRIGVALGRLAGYRTVEVGAPVSRPEELTTHGLVVGIYGNDPLVTSLVGEAPPAGRGVVRVIPAPHDPSLALLVVAGADEAGLRKATEALVGQGRYPVLSGPTALVSEVAETAVPPLSDEFLPFPRDRATASLAELGLRDTTVRGYYAETIRIPLDLGGDARANGPAALRLDFTHSALVDPRLSAIEVRVNGVVLRSRHLDGDGEPTSLSVSIPAEVLEPRNTVEVAFSLFPQNFDPCRRVSDQPLWATLLGSGTVTVGLDRYALLPDLSLLRERFWPLDLEPAHDGAAILLPAEPNADEASAALFLAAALGRTSPATEPRLTVAAGVAPSAVPRADLLVLDSVERPSAAWTALADAGKLTLTGDGARRLASGGTLLAADVGTPYATVEMVHDGDRDVLALRSARGGTVLDAVAALVDPTRLAGLSGNAAVLPADGEPRVLDVAPRVAVGKLSPGSRVQDWLRSAWGVMGVGVPVAALLASLIIRRWARSRGGKA